MNNLKLSLIVAGCITDQKDLFGIGYDGKIPWNLSKDMIHFKNTTTGHFVLMGLKTWLSIGKPLPNRMNIVVTSQYEKYNLEKYGLFEQPAPGNDNKKYLYDYLHFVPNLEQGFAFYQKNSTPEADLFVIGGGKIYQQILENYSMLIEKIFFTRIDHKYQCDTFIKMDIENKKYKKIFEANLLENQSNVAFTILIYLCV
jgi:dihydrofolate reductase